MTGAFVKAEDQDAVYRGFVRQPGRVPQQHRATAAQYVDVRLTRFEYEVIAAAVEAFEGEIDPAERADFDELVSLLERHGQLAGWTEKT